MCPNFVTPEKDDPRKVIFYFHSRYLKNSVGRINDEVYATAARKIKAHKAANKVVLVGSKKLLDQCDMVFFQRNNSIRRKGFNRESEICDIEYETNVQHVYIMDDYLDSEIQKYMRDEEIKVSIGQFSSYV